MGTIGAIIVAILTLIMLAFFYFLFRRNQKCEEFKNSIRERNIGMSCYYFVNEERRIGTILKGYNGTSDSVPIKTEDGHKIVRYVEDIYPRMFG